MPREALLQYHQAGPAQYPQLTTGWIKKVSGSSRDKYPAFCLIQDVGRQEHGNDGMVYRGFDSRRGATPRQTKFAQRESYEAAGLPVSYTS